jgi:long-chain acyl-CoA synthetase
MSARTLFTVLEETAAKFGALPALHQPIPGQDSVEYQTYTWSQYRDIAAEIASGLRTLGIGHGDVVALDTETRAEFYLADFGIMANGSVAAALYTSLAPADRARAIGLCDAKAVFAENPKTMRALQQAGAPENVVWILLTGQSEATVTLEELRARGREAMAHHPGFFDSIRAEVKDTDLAILYLTSGATGEPKMGLTTHRALVQNIEMGPQVLQLTPEDCTLAFLPSAHIAQRTGVEILPVIYGLQVYFSEGLSRMPAEIKRVRPTFLLAPPRVWERIYATVSTEIRKRPAITRKLFYGALGLGLHAARLRQQGKPVPGWMAKSVKIADRVVFEQIRARLGGRLRVPVSGAAPLGRELAQFYEAIGMPLVEGYGLTEGGITILNPIDGPRPGSIGKLLPGMQMRLAEDGELLLKGPSIFTGYYKDPAASALVLQEGWLHTGDLAEVDADGFIYITGRKKELIVSSNGKKVYPARIESLFKTDPLINQVVLLGDRQPYITALVTVNANIAETLDGMQPYAGRPLAEQVQAPPVIEQVKATVSKVNRQLAPFEQIKRYRILDREFSLENGEVTPTMKVRRQQVLENFHTVISELYLGREEMA